MNGLTNYVCEHLPGYRAGELRKAIDLGSCGHYGEFYGLSKRSFIQFLLQHQKANPCNGFQSGGILTPATPQPASAPDIDRRFNIYKDLTVTAYKYSKAGVTISGYSIIYKFLSDIELLKVGPEEKIRLFSEAKAATPLTEAKPASAMRDFIRQALNRPETVITEADIKRRAMEQAVIIFFKEYAGDIAGDIEAKRDAYTN